MQFRLVLIGVTIALAGLIAYSSIPTVHTARVIAEESIVTPHTVAIPSPSSFEIPVNLTVSQEDQNVLKINMTVTTQTGEPSALLFQIFLKVDRQACSNASPTTYIANQTVSHESLTARISTSGSYCFTFNNENSLVNKVVLLSAILEKSSDVMHIARDGGANIAGLGLGGFGLLLFLYGISRKTIIPWE